MTDKFRTVVDLTETSFSEQLNSSNSGGSPAGVPEELRCQYSSKRCENQRTHKKSGGLHKFCAMHREKANRNQMRLDHRRRVMKQQQKELQRQQQAQQMQQIQARQQQMQMRQSHASAAAMAAGQSFHYNRTQRSPVGAMRSPVGVKPMSPPNMTISMNMPVYPTMAMQPQQPQQQQPTPNIPLFDQHDLEILEALLFSSDEEQSDAAPVVHCSTPQFFRSPSFVNV